MKPLDFSRLFGVFDALMLCTHNDAVAGVTKSNLGLTWCGVCGAYKGDEKWELPKHTQQFRASAEKGSADYIGILLTAYVRCSHQSKVYSYPQNGVQTWVCADCGMITISNQGRKERFKSACQTLITEEFEGFMSM
jgi:hypothetical protein